MSEDKVTIWGIRSGSLGEADELFLKKNLVALSWKEVGNLSELGTDREAFKDRIKEVYPDIKRGAIPVWAGQLYRFVHEMKVNDIVAYPSKIDRIIHIGTIESDYQYNTSTSPEFPNLRSVKWIKHVPRTNFSQGALYEIGSALTLFKVRNYADEFLATIEGKKIDKEVTIDETVGIVADEIMESTRDFILKQLAKELKGHAFATFIAHLLNLMGYQTRVSPEGPDGGIDIIAHKDELGFEPPIIKVQVKSTVGNLGDPEISQLYGKVDPNEFGLFITLGGFTNQAIAFARNKSNLRLINGLEIVEIIYKYYEDLDSKYKGLIPLKKAYIPETIED